MERAVQSLLLPSSLSEIKLSEAQNFWDSNDKEFITKAIKHLVKSDKPINWSCISESDFAHIYALITAVFFPNNLILPSKIYGLNWQGSLRKMPFGVYYAIQNSNINFDTLENFEGLLACLFREDPDVWNAKQATKNVSKFKNTPMDCVVAVSRVWHEFHNDLYNEFKPLFLGGEDAEPDGMPKMWAALQVLTKENILDFEKLFNLPLSIVFMQLLTLKRKKDAETKELRAAKNRNRRLV